MTPKAKSNIKQFLAWFGAGTFIIGVVFSAGNFYSQTKETTNTSVPALRQMLEIHISKEETFKSKVEDNLNDIIRSNAVTQQKLEDLKEEFRNSKNTGK